MTNFGLKRSSYCSGFPALGLLLLCVMLAMSCTQERQPCLTPKVASLNMKCLHKLSDTSASFVDTNLPRAFFGCLTATGTRYFYYTTRLSAFTISLSPDADSCTWLITNDSLVNDFDTLHFSYQRNLQFLSNACGYTYFYSLLSVSTTHNNIDSVVITNPSVTNDVNIKQLSLYFRN